MLHNYLPFTDVPFLEALTCMTCCCISGEIVLAFTVVIRE